MRTGVRSVPLYSVSGKRCPLSVLLVDIVIFTKDQLIQRMQDTKIEIMDLNKGSFKEKVKSSLKAKSEKIKLEILKKELTELVKLEHSWEELAESNVHAHRSIRKDAGDKTIELCERRFTRNSVHKKYTRSVSARRHRSTEKKVESTRRAIRRLDPGSARSLSVSARSLEVTRQRAQSTPDKKTSLPSPTLSCTRIELPVPSRKLKPTQETTEDQVKRVCAPPPVPSKQLKPTQEAMEDQVEEYQENEETYDNANLD